MFSLRRPIVDVADGWCNLMQSCRDRRAPTPTTTKQPRAATYGRNDRTRCPPGWINDVGVYVLIRQPYPATSGIWDLGAMDRRHHNF